MVSTICRSCRSASSRGSFVNRPTIPGIGLCAFLHGGHFPGIPSGARRSEHFPDAARQAIYESLMEAQSVGGPAKSRQRNIKPGDINAAKPVDFLESHQPVPLFCAVEKPLVNKIGNSPLGTSFD